MTSHRNMGWRKPVPQFLPESTISSRLSRSSFKRFSILSTTHDAPPLPADWRETIERSLGRNKRSAFYMGRDNDSTDDVQPIDAEPLGQNSSPDATSHVTLGEKDKETHTPREEQKLASTPNSFKHVQALPEGYRPPTPPLPGHRSKLAAERGSPRHDPPSMQQHVHDFFTRRPFCSREQCCVPAILS
ncbi:hypothetical protein B0H21DRAFT_183655 [Amylocystis lapponica]|nr:hypothetical protein B0H21DRAFT_183655 [Amylocystis lapponica]